MTLTLKIVKKNLLSFFLYDTLAYGDTMCNYHTKFGHKRFSGSEDSRASARLLRLSAHTSGNNKTILVPTFSQPVQSTLLGLLMCPLPLPNKTCYIVMLLPLFKIKFWGSPFQSPPGTTWSAK